MKVDMNGWQTQPAAQTGRGLRWILVLLVLGAAVVILPFGAWIGGQVLYGLLPDVDTHITASPRLDGHNANVTGETNLPDGAVIAYSFFVPDSADATSVDGTATVQGGRFAVSADLSKLPAGQPSVDLTFGVGWDVDQPLNVVLVYGPYGERLAGDQVWSDSGDNLLEVTVSLESAA